MLVIHWKVHMKIRCSYDLEGTYSYDIDPQVLLNVLCEVTDMPNQYGNEPGTWGLTLLLINP